MQRRELRRALQQRLSPKRYQHVLRVARVATRLATFFRVSPDKAYVAALLHDVARELSDKQLCKYARKHNLKITAREKKYPVLLHGLVSANLAQRDFGITDRDILNAMSHHTVGRKKMSTLEKIIYVADYCEPGRKYAVADQLRRQLYKTHDLDQAVRQKQLNVIEYRRTHPKESA